MVDLSNENLYQYFFNYHQALFDEKFWDPNDLVLTIKYSQWRNLRILVEHSFTVIYYVKLHIEYTYGRNVLLMEQQRLSYEGVILVDAVKHEYTRIFQEVGYLDLEIIRVHDFGIEKLSEENKQH